MSGPRIGITGMLEGLAGKAWNQVPLDARVFLEGLAGNTQPITERALNPRQRAATAEMIQRRQGARVNELHEEQRTRRAAAPAPTRRAMDQDTRVANSGGGYIRYEDYANTGGQRAYNLAGDDDAIYNAEAEALNQVRTTLGRFRYQMEPEGIRIIDSYDFVNPGREERVAELNAMSPLDRAASTGKEFLEGLGAVPEARERNVPWRDILSALGGTVGMGVIGDRQRPVNILIPYTDLSRRTETP